MAFMGVYMCYTGMRFMATMLLVLELQPSKDSITLNLFNRKTTIGLSRSKDNSFLGCLDDLEINPYIAASEFIIKFSKSPSTYLPLSSCKCYCS